MKQLTLLVEKLKKNRENIPAEELQTKYKNAYQNLLKEIEDAGEVYLKKEVLKGMKVRDDDDGQKFIKRLNNFLDEERDGGLLLIATDALSKKYDVELFTQTVKMLRETVWSLYELYLYKEVLKEGEHRA